MKTEQETEKGKSTFRCGGHLIDMCTLADRCLVIQPKKYITYTTIMVSVNRILYNLQRCKKKEKTANFVTEGFAPKGGAGY